MISKIKFDDPLNQKVFAEYMHTGLGMGEFEYEGKKYRYEYKKGCCNEALRHFHVYEIEKQVVK